MSNNLKGYVVPREVGMFDSTLRVTLGVPIKIAGSTLAAYAGYQVAAHDVLGDPIIIGSVVQKLSGGVSQTMVDVKRLISTLVENADAIQNLVGEYFGGEEASRTDTNTLVNIGREAYGRSEIDIARAKNNFFNNTEETLIATGIAVAAIRFITHNLIDLILLRDKPTIGHRIRMGASNFFRRSDESREIDLPKKGGDKFTRI